MTVAFATIGSGLEGVLRVRGGVLDVLAGLLEVGQQGSDIDKFRDPEAPRERMFSGAVLVHRQQALVVRASVQNVLDGAKAPSGVGRPAERAVA